MISLLLLFVFVLLFFDVNYNNSSPSTPRREQGANRDTPSPAEKFSPYGIISGVIHDFSHLSDTKKLLLQR